MKYLFSLLVGLVFVMTMAMPAFAVPALQVYIEGSAYDQVTDTWIMNNSSSFKLWVLGDVGKVGTIYNVQLSMVHANSDTGNVTLTPATASAGYLASIGGDPSTPIVPTLSGSGVNNAPLMGDGSSLPSHGIYGVGNSWNTYALGDFTRTDSGIGDYISSLPSAFHDWGQINVYDVSVSGYTTVHFDAFDHFMCGNNAKYVKAPFSHDGEGEGCPVPEPASLSLLGFGLLGIFGLRKRKL